MERTSKIASTISRTLAAKWLLPACFAALTQFAVGISRAQGTTAAATPAAAEAADRLAIRRLIDDYAHHADRREAQQQAALFTSDAVIEVYDGEPGQHKPTAIIHGRQELLKGLEVLKQYTVTQHVNGQNTLVLNGDRATGEAYCLAHHIWTEKGQRMLMVMGIRYYDTFVRQQGKWLFAERKLIVDWVDKRPSAP